MSKYQVYQDYKSTNIEILGKIPCNWSTIRLKHMAKVKNGQDYKHVEVVGDNSGYPVIGSGGPFTKASIPMFTGESVLLGRKGTIDKPLYINGSFWTVDTMFYTEIRNNTSPKYLYYSSLTIPFDFYSTNTAVPSMTQEDLGSNFFAFPSLDEQKQIASFLDHETAKIDTLIDKQQQLIKLLKEKRQAVISHAVTKGLNPDAPMKDSGVEWLGDVPEHWNVSSLKHFWNILDCKHMTAEFVDEGIPLASIREVKSWYVDLTNAKNTTDAYYELLIEGNREPKAGDIIYSRNATVGESALVPSNMKFAMGQDVCMLSKISEFNSEFLLHQLKSPVVKLQLESLLIGSTFKRINVEEIRNFVISVPPKAEQDQISIHLQEKTSRYDTLISKSEKAIVLITERRTALISAAVTGKIDVRNWKPEQSQTSMEATA